MSDWVVDPIDCRPNQKSRGRFLTLILIIHHQYLAFSVVNWQWVTSWVNHIPHLIISSWLICQNPPWRYAAYRQSPRAKVAGWVLQWDVCLQHLVLQDPWGCFYILQACCYQTSSLASLSVSLLADHLVDSCNSYGPCHKPFKGNKNSLVTVAIPGTRLLHSKHTISGRSCSFLGFV